MIRINVTIITCVITLLISTGATRGQIFGGSNAPEGKHPYHVLLDSSRGINKYCGGSIVNKRWILTAAHCFRGEDVKKILAKVGSVLRSGVEGTYYGIEERIVHEAYNERTSENDVALLRVDRDILFNDRVQPITLASKDTVVIDDDEVEFTGFGRIEDHSLPRNLKTITLKVYGFEVCKEIQHRISDNQICTVPRAGTGPCKGDSGGPLVNKDGIQIGLFSHFFVKGPNPFVLSLCGKVPEFYMQISSFRDWIDNKIQTYTDVK